MNGGFGQGIFRLNRCFSVFLGVHRWMNGF